MTSPAPAARRTLGSVLLPLGWGLALATGLATASAVALTLVLDGPHAAETRPEPSHAHEQAHDQHSSGAQWVAGAPPATSAALRTGMTRLRQTLHGHTAATLDTPAALRLQRAVEADIATLITECDLPAAADAVLHGVLAELSQAAAALDDQASRAAALERLNQGLQRYSAEFAAPHWSQSHAAAN